MERQRRNASVEESTPSPTVAASDGVARQGQSPDKLRTVRSLFCGTGFERLLACFVVEGASVTKVRCASREPQPPWLCGAKCVSGLASEARCGVARRQLRRSPCLRAAPESRSAMADRWCLPPVHPKARATSFNKRRLVVSIQMRTYHAANSRATLAASATTLLKAPRRLTLWPQVNGSQPQCWCSPLLLSLWVVVLPAASSGGGFVFVFFAVFACFLLFRILPSPPSLSSFSHPSTHWDQFGSISHELLVAGFSSVFSKKSSSQND